MKVGFWVSVVGAWLEGSSPGRGAGGQGRGEDVKVRFGVKEGGVGFGGCGRSTNLCNRGKGTFHIVCKCPELHNQKKHTVHFRREQHAVHLMWPEQPFCNPYLAQGGGDRQKGGYYGSPANAQQPRSHPSSCSSHSQHNAGGP